MYSIILSGGPDTAFSLRNSVKRKHCVLRTVKMYSEFDYIRKTRFSNLHLLIYLQFYQLLLIHVHG